MPISQGQARDLLQLTLVKGLGPVFIARAVQTLGSTEAVLGASESALKRIKGIGPGRAREIAAGLKESPRLVEEELELAASRGVSIVALCDAEYPPLLREIPHAPPVLYVRGGLDAGEGGSDRYPVAIVGSRSCTQYGVEQAERFAMGLAQAGLTIVSGGARGIDTAAHRAALRAKGRTIAVLGCGLLDCYPPDNEELFAKIADGGGAVVSELPMRTPPSSENFPARNRIIAGLSLGVLVIEAGKGSGALITARLAVEEHGRDVFAVPGRADSAASGGSLELIKSGGAAMVTHAGDILAALESPAHHHFRGTHKERYNRPGRATTGDLFPPAAGAAPVENPTNGEATARPRRDAGLTESQKAILAALEEPLTVDGLIKATGAAAASLRADITVLEIRRQIQRSGSKLARRSGTDAAQK